MDIANENGVCKIKSTVFREITARTDAWGWARVLIEESTGRVVIVSDYGEWSYCWTSIGPRTLAEFLNQLNSQYMGEKMLGDRLRVHSDEMTILAIRESIIEHRRDRTLTKFEAKREWVIVNEYANGCGDFRHWCEATKFFNDCPWEYSRTEVVGYWGSFWDKLWVPLIKPALLEISKESNAANLTA